MMASHRNGRRATLDVLVLFTPRPGMEEACPPAAAAGSAAPLLFGMAGLWGALQAGPVLQLPFAGLVAVAGCGVAASTAQAEGWLGAEEGLVAGLALLVGLSLLDGCVGRITGPAARRKGLASSAATFALVGSAAAAAAIPHPGVRVGLLAAGWAAVAALASWVVVHASAFDSRVGELRWAFAGGVAVAALGAGAWAWLRLAGGGGWPCVLWRAWASYALYLLATGASALHAYDRSFFTRLHRLPHPRAPLAPLLVWSA
jgi:hypothetical protein